MQRITSKTVRPGEFDAPKHWYEKALNAQIHPMVAYFMNLGIDRIINRYCHMYPRVDKKVLASLLEYQPKHFFHAGTDLFHVTNSRGDRSMVVIETNSCPSGQKSMPLLDENQDQGGYRGYIRDTFAPIVRAKKKILGELAVLYDKNLTEASGYAAALADEFNEPVHLVFCPPEESIQPIRFTDSLLEVYSEQEEWVPIRAAFRYITNKPWAKIPIFTKTTILNPVITCLAGGRNKMMASKAYDFFNADIQSSGLSIKVPETIRDVRKEEIPLWVKKLGGQAVVKVPYSNAGQGVYTIIHESELERFMSLDFSYNLFIVQSLIGNYNWSSSGRMGRLYHVGTMPNKNNLSYVADLRMVVHATARGIRPIAIYARRARKPLVDELGDTQESWDILGTNLSIKNEDGSFTTDSSRLLLVDRLDFNRLGVGVDDLIEAYIQTVLSMIAIDHMSSTLLNGKGKLKKDLFRSLNDDPKLIEEILGR